MKCVRAFKISVVEVPDKYLSKINRQYLKHERHFSDGKPTIGWFQHESACIISRRKVGGGKLHPQWYGTFRRNSQQRVQRQGNHSIIKKGFG